MNDRLEIINGRIEEAKVVLQELEVKASLVKEEAQHEVVEELETYINDETLKKEGLLELSEEAWLEFKDLLDKMIAKTKEIVKQK